jgi:hypothetical protein
MRELPILCNERTVKAIRAGRQTQDRRPIAPQPKQHSTRLYEWHKQAFDDTFESPLIKIARCWRWQAGDHLWVRETCKAEELESGLDGVRYLADNAFRSVDEIVPL